MFHIIIAILFFSASWSWKIYDVKNFCHLNFVMTLFYLHRNICLPNRLGTCMNNFYRLSLTNIVLCGSDDLGKGRRTSALTILGCSSIQKWWVKAFHFIDDIVNWLLHSSEAERHYLWLHAAVNYLSLNCLLLVLPFRWLLHQILKKRNPV